MTTPKTKIQRGRDLENYVADEIRRKGLDPKASRSIGSGSGNREKADINTSLTILGRNAGIECKNYKVAHIQEWWRQTEKLCTIAREPVLAYKLERETLGETKVVIYLDTFLDLLKKNQAPKVQSPDRELKYLMDRARAMLQGIIKRLPE